MAQGRTIKKTCHNCGKDIGRHVNYCSWECMIDEAKKNGGAVHCPNGLPIASIKHDGTMWEHEHGDHPDYKFPVDVDFVGIRPDLPDWDCSYRMETHALLYTDGSIALTVYECNYTLFSLGNGMLLSGPGWLKKNEWRLSDRSQQEIQKRFPHT